MRGMQVFSLKKPDEDLNNRIEDLTKKIFIKTEECDEL
jgi:hypothetical protein